MTDEVPFSKVLVYSSRAIGVDLCNCVSVKHLYLVKLPHTKIMERRTVISPIHCKTLANISLVREANSGRGGTWSVTL